MAAQRGEAQALDEALRHAGRRRPVRWAHAPIRLARLKLARTPTTMRARLFWGGTMLVTPPEPLSEQLLLYGFHEEGLTRFMLEKVRPGMVVIDVGAHYGYFTLLAAHLVGERGSVHAFEPTPATAEILARNVACKPNVRVNRVAAWRCSEELELQDIGIAGSMFNSVFARDRVTPTGVIKVPAIALDQYVQEQRIAPGFIKIDAESAEPQVLEGLHDTLHDFRPMVSIEVGETSPGQVVSSHGLLERLQDEYEYEPLEFSDGVIRPHQPQRAYKCDNILLVAH